MAFKAGPGLGVQGSWHLSPREAVVVGQRWVTGQQEVWALLRRGAAPELCCEPVEKEEESELSGCLGPPGDLGEGTD